MAFELLSARIGLVDLVPIQIDHTSQLMLVEGPTYFFSRDAPGAKLRVPAR